MRNSAIALGKVLERLNKFKTSFPNAYHSLEPDIYLDNSNAKNDLPIPATWVQILAVDDGFEILDSPGEGRPDGFIFYPAEEIPTMHTQFMHLVLADNAKFPPYYLFVASSYSDHLIGLDTSNIDDVGDCPVVLVWLEDEGYNIGERWDSISDFLNTVLDFATPYQEDEDSPALNRSF